MSESFGWLVARWCTGKVSDEWLRDHKFPSGLLSSNNLEQVIYTCDAQANSAFDPSGVGKWVAGKHYEVKSIVQLAGA